MYHHRRHSYPELGEGSGNLFCKKPGKKYIRFHGPHGLLPQPLNSTKAAIDKIQTNARGCVPIKLYFIKTSSGPDLMVGCNLLALALDFPVLTFV